MYPLLSFIALVIMIYVNTLKYYCGHCLPDCGSLWTTRPVTCVTYALLTVDHHVDKTCQLTRRESTTGEETTTRQLLVKRKRGARKVALLSGAIACPYIARVFTWHSHSPSHPSLSCSLVMFISSSSQKMSRPSWSYSGYRM